jgi:HEAT repeat protein
MEGGVDAFLLFALLFGGSVGVALALALLVAGRKLLRDRREARSAARQVRYEAAFASGDRKVLRAALSRVRDASAQVDLAALLHDPDRVAVDRAVLDVEMRRSGLLARLEGQLRSSRPSVRGRAVLILSRLRVPGRVGRLEHMLDDTDPDVRLVTCAGLPLARDPEAIDALIGALSHRRLAPERVIEHLGQPWAVDALLDVLRGLDESGERRAAPRVGIARALGVAGDPRAEPALVALLVSGNLEERISAARALGSVGGTRARRELERALGDPAWQLRAQAAKALGAIANERSATALEAVLGDPAWWVRANAATALRQLGDPGHAALVRTLSHDDPYARDRAREALAMAMLPTA